MKIIIEKINGAKECHDIDKSRLNEFLKEKTQDSQFFNAYEPKKKDKGIYLVEKVAGKIIFNKN